MINNNGRSSVWGVVALGFLTLVLAFTIRGSLSLAMPVWDVEFNWSRSSISGIAAIALIVMALIAPVAGGVADRRGPRAPLIGGMGPIGVGMAMEAAACPDGSAWLLTVGFCGDRRHRLACGRRRHRAAWLCFVDSGGSRHHVARH